MRNIWIFAIVGSLLLSVFTTTTLAENRYDIPDDVYAELEEYRVKEEDYPTVQFLPLLGLLGVVSTTLNVLLALFSSTSKTEIIGSITKLGFDRIEQTTYISFYKNFPGDKFTMFKNMIMNQVEVPAEKRASF
jgi:hypothetical protein